MAQAKITLTCKTCGDSFEHAHFCHNRTEADQYAEWARSSITECPRCYAARKKAEKQEKIDRTINSIALARLSGSDKQVKWANDIRAEIIAGCIDTFGADAISADFIDAVNLMTDSKWWIDHRGLRDVAFCDALSDEDVVKSIMCKED